MKKLLVIAFILIPTILLGAMLYLFAPDFFRQEAEQAGITKVPQSAQHLGQNLTRAVTQAADKVLPTRIMGCAADKKGHCACYDPQGHRIPDLDQATCRKELQRIPTGR